MKLYLISQTENRDWDTFDSFVVAAKNENDARLIVPLSKPPFGSWCYSLEVITVKEIGTAN